MATELVWYEVIDMTSVGIKYPNDWFTRCGRIYEGKYYPAFDILGKFSTEEKALRCLRKWAEEKGIDFEENSYESEIAEYYEPDCDAYCKIIKDVGLYYNSEDKQVERNSLKWLYCTSAMAVKKTLTLDEDES